jgi:hypothetical protein
LSVFLVPKADADEHAKRIAAAMAAKMRKLVVRYEYILFDAARLDTAGVRIENRPGETPDAVVNTWHRDLTVLSADQLADIAEAMWDARETMGFHLDDELAELIAGGINGHQLDPGMIKQGILDPLRHRGLIG